MNRHVVPRSPEPKVSVPAGKDRGIGPGKRDQYFVRGFEAFPIGCLAHHMATQANTIPLSFDQQGNVSCHNAGRASGSYHTERILANELANGLRVPFSELGHGIHAGESTYRTLWSCGS